jgi:pimeloyl-ACP methyl ester carboxylesterase
MPFLQLALDYTIRYELIDGDAAQPYLVFLHEGLGCVEMWKRFPHDLCEATGCPGLLYDRRGYGQSSPFAAPRTIHYLHNYALNELPQVLAALIPGRDYVVIGHSDGGTIALIHAAERPARLLGAITAAAHVSVEDVALAGVAAAQESYRAGKLTGLAKFHGAKTDAVFRAWADTWRSDWFRSWNIEYLLPAIACPALIMQGVHDQYGTYAQVEAIVSHVKNAQEAMIEDCGHVPHLEQPALVRDRMAHFIRSLPRG